MYHKIHAFKNKFMDSDRKAFFGVLNCKFNIPLLQQKSIGNSHSSLSTAKKELGIPVSEIVGSEHSDFLQLIPESDADGVIASA